MMKNENGYNWDHLLGKVDEITFSAKLYDINKVMDSLKTFIPEYVPDYTNEIDWVENTAKKISSKAKLTKCPEMHMDHR